MNSPIFKSKIAVLVKNKWIQFIILSIPIIIFCFGLLLTKNKLAPGDGDYLTQTYEAMRLSILKYHQFPWWNPWVSGGVPLFANPQFGLFSIATPLVLIFGAPFGIKLTLVSYFIIGFWGFRNLFIKYFKTPIVTATLLAYIWTFGSFLTQRSSGHYTFLLIQLFPWAFYFFLTRKTDSKAWLKFGLIISLMANSAAHYMTILSYLVIGLVFIFESIKLIGNKKQSALTIKLIANKTDLIFWLKAGGLFFILSFYRLFFTFQYLSDYPRLTINPETTVGPLKGLFAMFGPFRQFGPNTPSMPLWGWLEASAYIGFCTGIVALIVGWLYFKNRHSHNKLFSYSPFIILTLVIIFFILGLGDILGKYSPFLMLKQLPILSSMRVATRWFAWSSVFVLVFISTYKGTRYRKIINILLLVSVIELFVYSRPQISKPYVLETNDYSQKNKILEQKRHYNDKRYGIPYDENLTEATRLNYGQIIAGDSLIDTRFSPPVGIETLRCSIDEGCDFIISNNAKVTSWSPTKFTLERTSGIESIELNINPGSCWIVNNRYLFLKSKVTEPGAKFIIKDRSNTLDVECIPRFSAEWFLNKVF